MRRRSFLRAGHGNGKGEPRIELPPADELAAPIPAAPAPLKRHQDGRIADRETAKALGRKGGFARAHKARLVAGLGLGELAADAAFRPFQLAAEEFMKQHVATLAMQAGGECGPAPSTMIASAALQLAASRFLFERGATTGEVSTLKAASSLADASRQNLLAAYELATREASARKTAAPPIDWAHFRAQAERVADADEERERLEEQEAEDERGTE